MRTLSRYFFTGLLVLLPTWATFLILAALVSAVNRAIADLLGHVGVIATPLTSGGQVSVTSAMRSRGAWHSSSVV